MYSNIDVFLFLKKKTEDHNVWLFKTFETLLVYFEISTKVFSKILTTGTIIVKCAKYRTVLTCPKVINGSSTCLPPNTINIRKLATNTKKKNLLIGLNCKPLDLPKSNKGNNIIAKIALNMAITPNNLLGIDLKIA
jgi:hypothetical protein